MTRGAVRTSKPAATDVSSHADEEIVPKCCRQYIVSNVSDGIVRGAGHAVGPNNHFDLSDSTIPPHSEADFPVRSILCESIWDSRLNSHDKPITGNLKTKSQSKIDSNPPQNIATSSEGTTNLLSARFGPFFYKKKNLPVRQCQQLNARS